MSKQDLEVAQRAFVAVSFEETGASERLRKSLEGLDREELRQLVLYAAGCYWSETSHRRER